VRQTAVSRAYKVDVRLYGESGENPERSRHCERRQPDAVGSISTVSDVDASQDAVPADEIHNSPTRDRRKDTDT